MLAVETEWSQTDVTRAMSRSDKGHFPQRRRSLIFLITNTGEKVAKVAGGGVGGGKKSVK